MSKNSLIYFILFSLLQFLLVEINCLKPSQRYLHTTTFINNKLYVLGGRFVSDDSIYSLGREVLYLDFSVPFITTQESLPWVNLSSINFVPPYRAAASVVGGIKNHTIFLYGGETNYEKMAAVYTFSERNNTWGIPSIDGYDGNNVNANGNNADRKALLTGIVDDGKMYLWGGRETVSQTCVNDMLILDTVNVKWDTGSMVNAPTPRCGYGATLLPNHKIIYMGGFNAQSIGLDEVYIYDTLSNSWDTQTISGKSPSNRQGFSANLGLDGQRIIIFGGSEIDPKDALYVLSLTDFKWYIPKISGNIPTSRSQHKSDVIGNYLVVTFGIGYSDSNESDVLLLDISNNDEYKWTTNFGSSPSSSPSSPLPLRKSHKVATIISACVIGAMIFIVGIFYLHKWNKNRKVRKIAINPSTSVKLDKSIVLTMVNDNGQESKQDKK
uniref:Kelch domain-containing protein 3 n=1 Tax=Anthurium amnicola TaxID=1678845 RepID=A0A1D1YE72_9ARAE